VEETILLSNYVRKHNYLTKLFLPQRVLRTHLPVNAN